MVCRSSKRRHNTPHDPTRHPDSSLAQITRRWARRGDHPALARRGTRPLAPRDQRTRSTYLRRHLPGRGDRGRSDPAALQLRRNGTAPGGNLPNRDAGAYAVLLVDQTGRHLSDKLAIPDNITLMPLPPTASRRQVRSVSVGCHTLR
jgi:hypothetical protein